MNLFSLEPLTFLILCVFKFLFDSNFSCVLHCNWIDCTIFQVLIKMNYENCLSNLVSSTFLNVQLWVFILEPIQIVFFKENYCLHFCIVKVWAIILCLLHLLSHLLAFFCTLVLAFKWSKKLYTNIFHGLLTLFNGWAFVPQRMGKFFHIFQIYTDKPNTKIMDTWSSVRINS